MASSNDENIFAPGWGNSDLVLVVEDRELHVHRLILTMVSPVFKAMLEGNYREARQEKITLEGKSYESMELFLKLIYPRAMFKESKIVLNDKSRLDVMKLCDEYQCDNLIKHLIDEAKLTPQNVLQLLPFVLQYNQAVLPQICSIINWGTPTSKLEEIMPTIDSKETSNKILLSKCHFLESSVVHMQDGLFALVCDRLKESYRSSETTAKDSRCAHSIKVREIAKTKMCPHCMEKYKNAFLNGKDCQERAQHYFDILQRGNDIATVVKQNK